MSRYPKLILASQSPRRQELLRNITPDFTVQVSQVEENLAPGTSPGEAVEQLALRKAQAVLRLQPDPEDCIVIGSDTVVAIDGRILGKPKDKEDAKAMLEKSHAEVLKLAEAFTNEELFSKGVYKWVGGSTLGSYFVSVTASHYDWAIKKLKAHKKNCAAV